MRKRNREHFELLKLQRDKIEEELRCELEWQELPDRKVSRIAIRLVDADPANKKDWERQHEWIVSKLEAFQDTFRHRIKELNADDYDSEPEE